MGCFANSKLGYTFFSQPFKRAFEVVIIRGHAFTAGISVVVASAFIGGPKLAAIVVLSSTLLAELWLRRKIFLFSPARYFIIVAFHAAQLLISAVIVGIVFVELSGQTTSLWTLLDFFAPC